MSTQKTTKYPRGRPPWDTWNGLRVGALAGGILGIVLTVWIGASNYWLALPTALIGAAIGYWLESNR